jgi:hypothetical protein
MVRGGGVGGVHRRMVGLAYRMIETLDQFPSQWLLSPAFRQSR